MFFAHTMLGIEPVTPDGSPFCEYARITADRIEGEAPGWALLGFALLCLLTSCCIALGFAWGLLGVGLTRPATVCRGCLCFGATAKMLGTLLVYIQVICMLLWLSLRFPSLLQRCE